MNGGLAFLETVVYCGEFSNIHPTLDPLGNSSVFWEMTQFKGWP